MNLKYRVLELDIPHNHFLCVAQYKILGMWLCIKNNQTGAFFIDKRSFCYTKEEAFERIRQHQNIMSISKYWWEKTKRVIWKSYE
jgi:hypothetical protein